MGWGWVGEYLSSFIVGEAKCVPVEGHLPLPEEESLLPPEVEDLLLREEDEDLPFLAEEAPLSLEISTSLLPLILI